MEFVLHLKIIHHLCFLIEVSLVYNIILLSDTEHNEWMFVYIYGSFPYPWLCFRWFQLPTVNYGLEADDLLTDALSGSH